MKLRLQYASAVGNGMKREFVKAAALEYLRTLEPGRSISTGDLSEALWPVALATGEHITERKAMIDDLLRLARTELRYVCAKQGPPDPHRKFMGKPLIPWLWYNPGDGIGAADHEICPLCGR